MGHPHPQSGPPGEVTRLLSLAAQRSSPDQERLLALIYGELRRLAERAMSREPAGHTLQPTALVHEAWMRLVGGDAPDWNDRHHFFRTAARAMRRILIDRARRVEQPKHGGGRLRVTLGGADADGRLLGPDLDALSLYEAMEELEGVDARMAEIVSLRFFTGLSVEETGHALGVSPRTVKREWSVARAWLSDRLGEEELALG